MDNNQEPQVQEPAAEKMFTQAELDEIIGKRLAAGKNAPGKG